MTHKNETSPATAQSQSRRSWTPPRVRHLAAGEAEFNPVITTDAEGTS